MPKNSSENGSSSDSLSHKIILGFDFGMKYIGVAVGQSVTQTASPVTTLLAKDGIPKWEEIQLLIQKWQPHDLVVGIPLNMDGTEQPITFCARRFANRLKVKMQLPVHAVDERLTSWEAKNRAFSEAKHRNLKISDNNLHALAAMILIEQWMTEQKI
jgi:putative Holliday junction resolvase